MGHSNENKIIILWEYGFDFRLCVLEETSEDRTGTWSFLQSAALNLLAGHWRKGRLLLSFIFQISFFLHLKEGNFVPCGRIQPPGIDQSHLSCSQCSSPSPWWCTGENPVSASSWPRQYLNCRETVFHMGHSKGCVWGGGHLSLLHNLMHFTCRLENMGKLSDMTPEKMLCLVKTNKENGPGKKKKRERGGTWGEIESYSTILWWHGLSIVEAEF